MPQVPGGRITVVFHDQDTRKKFFDAIGGPDKQVIDGARIVAALPAKVDTHPQPSPAVPVSPAPPSP